MYPRPTIKHCKHCGGVVNFGIPTDGDTKLRAICTSCKSVLYENPLNVVGTLPIWQDRVLLCKRNIEPRKGMWTLPAGFMELGETLSEGAARETDEEAGAQYQLQGLYTITSVLSVGQVHFYFRADLTSTQFNPGHETQETRLFLESEIPWDQLAFRTVKETLLRFFEDRKSGHFPLHEIVLHPEAHRP
jgi:ADP-ribose pyrophosphatase YjhB (NUDIX family)